MNVEVASTAAAGVDNVGTKDVDRAGCITDFEHRNTRRALSKVS